MACSTGGLPTSGPRCWPLSERRDPASLHDRMERTWRPDPRASSTLPRDPMRRSGGGGSERGDDDEDRGHHAKEHAPDRGDAATQVSQRGAPAPSDRTPTMRLSMPKQATIHRGASQPWGAWGSYGKGWPGAHRQSGSCRRGSTSNLPSLRCCGMRPRQIRSRPSATCPLGRRRRPSGETTPRAAAGLPHGSPARPEGVAAGPPPRPRAGRRPRGSAAGPAAPETPARPER
jgi:hypothetical protein